MSLRCVSRFRAALLAALVSAVLAVLTPTAALATVSPPSSDPFYTYSGSLSSRSPGTVLASRTVTIELGGQAPAFTATQVLYRTTDQLGDPDATVATIIHPATSGPIKLVSYQTAYDGLADTCRPSYQLRGGTPVNSTVEDESAAISAYLAQGFTVVTSDYEGSTDDFGAGRQEGSQTLDAIRAAELQLGQPLKSTPVGMVGYSGGAIASMWAAQLQPTYAPQMDLIGVAAGGIAADFAHNLSYIDGSTDWAVKNNVNLS